MAGKPPAEDGRAAPTRRRAQLRVVLQRIRAVAKDRRRERALGALGRRRVAEWWARRRAMHRMQDQPPNSTGARESLASLGPSPAHLAGGAAATSGEWLEPILVDYFTRDGSTLMMRLLGSSPEIAVEQTYPYERKYFAYIWRWAQMLDRRDWQGEDWGPSALASLAQQRQSALLGPPPWQPRDLIQPGPGDGAMADRCFELAWGEFSRRAAGWTRAQHGDPTADVRYYAEKHLNTWRTEHEDLPPLRLVALLRDPRDTFVSINAFNRKRGDAGFGRDRIGGREEDVQRVIARQRERLRWIAGLLDGGQVPVIRYEDLVLDLPGVARRLEAWLGVRIDHEAVSADSQVRRVHVSAESPAESIGRWRRELDPAVAEAFTSDLGPELRAVGLGG